MDCLRGIIGILAILGVAFLLSDYKKRIDWKLVGIGLLLQLIIAVCVLKVPVVRGIFETLGSGLVTFLSFALNGAEFLFGDLAKNSNSTKDVHHNLGFI